MVHRSQLILDTLKTGKKWVLICCITVGIESCEKVENFTDPQGPKFTGFYAPDTSGTIPDEIRVVTFNIEFAIKIDEAIRELGETENLKDADILLLQEMDEVGTEIIARTLAYNYVYYPSNRNLDDQLFGLAILSKWPIVDDEKLLLPHETPINERRRIAVTANILVGSQTIRIYNLHTATLSVPKAKRRDQFRAVVNHLNQVEQMVSADQAIIAGDFNTDKSNDIDFLVNLYKEEGFNWANENVGPTWQKFSGIRKFRLDHVFTRGFEITAAGKPSESKASDHLPIWVRLRW